MKRYKYIGTEEQLVEHGFDMETRYFGKNPTPLIHGTRIAKYDKVYIILQRCYDSDENDIRLLQWDMDETLIDITPYIQDLIDDGLVEVLS